MPFWPSYSSNVFYGFSSLCLFYYCVVPENIHTPPPRKGFAVWPPLPLWIFQNWPPKFTPPLPSGISNIFAHPLETLLSLIQMNKEVVLFTRMPNFVSFMYFLLNCITDKWIPLIWELLLPSSHRQILCVSCNFCWILQFCKWNARSPSEHNCTFHALRQEESNT